MMLGPSQLQHSARKVKTCGHTNDTLEESQAVVIEHQHIHNADELGSTIKINRLSTPDRGRILVAESFIPEGTVMEVISPQAIVCDTENRTKRCGGCLGPLSRDDVRENGRQGDSATLACEGCCEIWYCTEKCRGQDWNVVHRFECMFLRRLYNGNNSGRVHDGIQQQSFGLRNPIERFREMDGYEQDYCRVLMRTLIHRFKEYLPPHAESSSQCQDQEPEDEALPFSEVLDLVENRSSFSSEKLEGDIMDVALILDAFQTHLEQNSPNGAKHSRMEEGEENMGAPRLTIEELVGLILKEECNSFGLYEYPTVATPSTTTPTATIATNSKTSYALGFFIRNAYRYNHSCTPNTYHVGIKNRLVLFAARDISQGEELTITYLEFGPLYRIPSAGQRGQDKEISTREMERKTMLEKRRGYLKEVFFFDCECQRCAWELSMNWGSPLSGVNKSMMDQQIGKEEEEEDRFLREGLVCKREGCFGFYIPPAVLKMVQDGTRRYAEKQQQQEQVEIKHWGCVACGCQRVEV